MRRTRFDVGGALDCLERVSRVVFGEQSSRSQGSSDQGKEGKQRPRRVQGAGAGAGGLSTSRVVSEEEGPARSGKRKMASTKEKEKSRSDDQCLKLNGMEIMKRRKKKMTGNVLDR